MTTKTVITGLQPSGDLHIGNYVGSIEQILKLQEKYECLLFVADLHAMTVPYDPKKLRERSKEVVRIALAAGVDPDKCLIFLQSMIPQHTELAWILNTQLPLAELERMTQYKEKAARNKVISAGLFNYPVLMAADIVLYQVDLVPVGQDQVQHVELARTAARKFNKQFGRGKETLKLPKSLLTDTARIIGTDGKGKMSKSMGNTIGLLDSVEDVRKKVRKAVVKPAQQGPFEGKKPMTIFEWHDIKFDSPTTQTLSTQCHNEDRNCEGYKELVAKNISSFLGPLQKKREKIVKRGDDWLLRFLSSNAEIVRSRAEITMKKVREQAGLNLT